MKGVTFDPTFGGVAVHAQNNLETFSAKRR